MHCVFSDRLNGWAVHMVQRNDCNPCGKHRKNRFGKDFDGIAPSHVAPRGCFCL
jgi:hypothetical protein